MDYVLSHLPSILLACVIVAASAVLWWYSMELSAKRKRERVQARKAAAAKIKNQSEDNQ